MKWIPVSERLPPDNWRGLIVADVRPDRPVFAHTADEHYRKEFPFDDYFIGPWRESLLIGNHMRDKAKVTYWLEGLVIPEPPGGTMKPDMKEIPCDELQQLMKKLQEKIGEINEAYGELQGLHKELVKTFV